MAGTFSNSANSSTVRSRSSFGASLPALITVSWVRASPFAFTRYSPWAIIASCAVCRIWAVSHRFKVLINSVRVGIHPEAEHLLEMVERGLSVPQLINLLGEVTGQHSV